MSSVGAIFLPFPPKTGTNMLHPLPPLIVELVVYYLRSEKEYVEYVDKEGRKAWLLVKQDLKSEN